MTNTRANPGSEIEFIKPNIPDCCEPQPVVQKGA